MIVFAGCWAMSTKDMPITFSAFVPGGSGASLGSGPVRSIICAPSTRSAPWTGRSVTRSSSTTSPSVRVTPALIVEITSNPGCEGSTSLRA